MTDSKKPEIDPLFVASIYTNLLRVFHDSVEGKRADTRISNRMEALWYFLSILSFRHLTTPISLVECVVLYWFDEKEVGRRFILQTTRRELRVFGVRLASWPTEHILSEHTEPFNRIEPETKESP